MANIEQRDVAARRDSNETERAEALEREAERERARLGGTLDELRDRLTPGQMLDSVLEYGRGDPGQMVDNLKRQVVNNPMALGLIGAGLTWLMTSSGQQPRPSYARRSAYATGPYNPKYGTRVRGDGAAASLREGAGEGLDRLKASGNRLGEKAAEAGKSAAAQAGDAAHRLGERAGEAASRTEGLASKAADSASAYAGQAAEAASDYANDAATRLRGATSGLGEQFSETEEYAEDMLSRLGQQPLVLAGIGLALGAALGAAFPPTEAEDALMGARAEELKRRAGETIEEETEALRGKAREAVEAAKEKAGETMGQMRETAEQAARKAREAAEGGADKARQAAEAGTEKARQSVETGAEQTRKSAETSMPKTPKGG